MDKLTDAELDADFLRNLANGPVLLHGTIPLDVKHLRLRLHQIASRLGERSDGVPESVAELLAESLEHLRTIHGYHLCPRCCRALAAYRQSQGKERGE